MYPQHQYTTPKIPKRQLNHLYETKMKMFTLLRAIQIHPKEKIKKYQQKLFCYSVFATLSWLNKYQSDEKYEIYS